MKNKSAIKKVVTINKKTGETPLQAIFSFKSKNEGYKNLKMTYAGRLDPMAEGLLLCLVGDECKNKDKYLACDKEYVFEILIGFSTDTHDLLGLVTSRNAKTEAIKKEELKRYLKGFVGRSVQAYPAYSSKTIGGKQLHFLARRGEIKTEQLPKIKIEIFKLDLMSRREVAGRILLEKILKKIDLVSGDFRQGTIKKTWRKKLSNRKTDRFAIFKLKMKCSSGTYVRGLVRDLSCQMKVPMCVFSIKRTGIMPLLTKTR